MHNTRIRIRSNNNNNNNDNRIKNSQHFCAFADFSRADLVEVTFVPSRNQFHHQHDVKRRQ